jgi:hypothetical protein
MYDPKGKDLTAGTDARSGWRGAGGTPGKRTRTQMLGRGGTLPLSTGSRGALDHDPHTEKTDGDQTDKQGGDGSLFSVVSDLGVFGGMLALKKALTAAIWQIAPQPGNAAEVKLSASVSVEGIVAKFSFEAEIDHLHDGGFELSTKTSSMVGIGMEGKCQADLGIYQKQSVGLRGKTPDVCIDEVGLYFDLWLREQAWSRKSFTDPAKWVALVKAIYTGDMIRIISMVAGNKIADLLFGRGFEKLVVSEMAVGDHVQWSEEIGLQGGFKVKGGGEDGFKFGLEGSAGFKSQTTATKEKNGELDIERENGFVWDASAELDVKGVGVKLSAGGFCPPGKKADLDVTLALELDVGKGKDWMMRLVGAYEVAKIGFAGNVAASQFKDNQDVLAVTAALFGSEAHAALSLVGLISGVYNRVGIRFKYERSENVIVVAVYSGIKHEMDGEGFSASFEFHDLQEVARIPL